MKTRTQAMKLRLCALVLGIGVAAQAAAPTIRNIEMVATSPRLGIQSEVGSTNEIQYSTNLSQSNWTVLTNLVVVESPYWFVDVAATPGSRRFYRVEAFPIVPTNMALIPAGSFQMGDPFSEGDPDESPLHTVYVSAFYMDKYEVTKALWDVVYQWATNNGYSFDNAGSGKAADHPVQRVNRFDALKWCNARSEKNGSVPAYYTSAAQTTVYRSGQTNVQNDWVKWNAGYRLPTEAEWEKAARGGATGHRFPWTDVDTIDHSRANYMSVSTLAYDVDPTPGYDPVFDDGIYPYTSPVGYFAANGYGLYDMAGNVWEWCWDWVDSTWYSKAGATQNDTRGPSGPLTWRVVRGGLCCGMAYFSRCAYRLYAGQDAADEVIGFRCARGL